MGVTHAMRHAVPLLLPASYLLGLRTGSVLLVLGPALFLFVLTPVLDALLPHDRSAGASSNPLSGLVPAIYVAAHAACLLATAASISSGIDWSTAMIALISLGTAGGVLICACHELLHSPERWRRSMGRMGMTMVAYGHFEIAHLHGHHRNACTRVDYSTAYRGESLYQYFARALPECFRFARDEARRRKWIWPVRHAASPVVSLSISLALATAAGLVAGPLALLVILGHAAIAVGLLESTSYIEHYGLLRRETTGGVQPFTAEHSWDSRHAMSNALLFRLPRHADHHLHGARHYTRLELNDEARALPCGYPAMIMLAMIPAWWRRVMDPLLDEQSDAPALA